MSYEAAVNKSWEELAAVNKEVLLSVKFLADEYTVDCPGRKVSSLACNVPAKDFTAILILHYLAQRLKGLPEPTGEWVSFKELANIEGYYPAFRKRAVEPVIRKYGSNPQGILSVLERLPGRKAAQGDVAVCIEAFTGVPVLVVLWKGDDEFGPEASLLFDRNIAQIFCTEDIVVLAGMVAYAL